MATEDKRLKRRIRNSYFISTLSIAMVLFLLGAATYLILSALNVTDKLKESVTIYAMLDDRMTSEEIVELKTKIESQNAVRQVVYVSKSEAAAQFIAESGEDFTTFLGELNPLPNTLEISLMAHVSEKKATVSELAATVEAMPGVQEVVYQRNIVEQIGNNIGKFNLIMVLFGATLLIISIILLSNTIQMTIISKYQIISTMKLVGANKNFILKPFLVSATLQGIYAWLVATAMFIVMVVGLSEKLPEINLLHGNKIVISISAAMFILGVAISLIFTYFSISRAVKQTTGKAYL